MVVELLSSIVCNAQDFVGHLDSMASLDNQVHQARQATAAQTDSKDRLVLQEILVRLVRQEIWVRLDPTDHRE